MRDTEEIERPTRERNETYNLQLDCRLVTRLLPVFLYAHRERRFEINAQSPFRGSCRVVLLTLRLIIAFEPHSYSCSKTTDFDKPRSIVHRCEDDCGGIEHEYCFAEYEYRVAEYDINRSNQTPSVSSLFVLHAVRKTQTARVHPPHPPTPSPPLGGEGELRLNRVYT